MQHPAELSVHSYLRKSIDGKAGMSQEVIDKVAEDIKEALHKQFNSEKRKFKVIENNKIYFIITFSFYRILNKD